MNTFIELFEKLPEDNLEIAKDKLGHMLKQLSANYKRPVDLRLYMALAIKLKNERLNNE